MDDDAFDYEAAKAAALAQQPTFGGSWAPSPAAPSGKGVASSSLRAEAAPFASVGLKAPGPPPPLKDAARLTERAARFKSRPPSAAAQHGQHGFHTAIAPHDLDGGEALPAPGAIVGVCEDMCPAAERERREHLHDIQIFERVDINDSGRTSAELAVRRFARTIDDPQPTDFRTRAALLRTMLYLRSLLDRQDVRFGLVHKFLWDRYRAVRQDLYVQGITDEFAIAVYEEVVRFHVMCEHELCGEDQSVTEMEGFNSHLNIEQMNKALISLSDMYETQAEKGQPVQSEPEFRAYHLLSLMAQHGKFKGDQQAFLATLQALRAEVKTSPPILWVLQLQRAYACDNYVAFFSLVDRAPYLMACLAHVYFPQVGECVCVYQTATWWRHKA